MERFAADVAANWILGISPEGAGAIGMVLNFAVATTVAKIAAPPPVYIQCLVEDLRIPRESVLNPPIVL